MRPLRSVEIAVVGGGPAGAAVAARLAGAGREVVLFERWPAPRWRACGVYSTPQTGRDLLDLGLTAAEVAALTRPVPELVVETLGGASCRLPHVTAGPALGVDRVRLERALLDRAKAVGASVNEGAVVRSVRWPHRRPDESGELDVSLDGAAERWSAQLVIGADGPRSLVARAAGLSLRPVPVRRAGVTGHRTEARPNSGGAAPARLVFGPGWYLGFTPVPGDRINLGLVLARERLRELTKRGASETLRDIAAVVPARNDAPALATDHETDAVQVSYPLAHRVRRLARPGVLLVGDAAGFIDPVTGEGLHRAFLSADTAATAVSAWRAGRTDAFTEYDARLRALFARKDAISWLLQLFMTHPRLLDYAVRRLDRRARLRRTFGMVMTDLAPPEAALNARFIASLLAP